MQIDLKNGVVPISFAQAHLAELINRARKSNGPIVITQKGVPTSVLLDVDTYALLNANVEAALRANAPATRLPDTPAAAPARTYPTPADHALGRGAPDGWRPDGFVVRHGERHDVSIVTRGDGELFVSGLTFAGWVRVGDFTRVETGEIGR